MENMLKKKRTSLGLSQQQLANLSKINLRTLQDYEQGRKSLRLASADVIYKLSITLNCHMEDLIMDYVIQQNIDSQSQRLILYNNALAEPTSIGQVNLSIDDLVPCLTDTLTKEKVDTAVFKIESRSFLSKYNKHTGWHINWSKLPNDVDIYALTTTNDNQIQGLIALKDDVLCDAIYIHWACTAPHNNIAEYGSQKYAGVGGHLFAIAAEKSISYGHLGYVYGFANCKTTLHHYIEKLGAIHFAAKHPYQFIIDDEHANKLLEIYTYEWSDPS
ncbi:MAG: helix-turn-helix domain-containing protein [Lachnospiraceae bacterium]|nr:helix-turn-helix domain-containing protein [Lachnospiraceae bacterium]